MPSTDLFWTLLFEFFEPFESRLDLLFSKPYVEIPSLSRDFLRSSKDGNGRRYPTVNDYFALLLSFEPWLRLELFDCRDCLEF